MSSDGLFEDEYDEDMFQQADALEAAATQAAAAAPLPKRGPALPPDNEDSDYFEEFSMNAEDLAALDQAEKGAAFSMAAKPKASTIQTTLFGDVLSNDGASTSKAASSHNINATRTAVHVKNPFGKQAAKTKRWDYLAVAQAGAQRAKSKAKGRKKSWLDDEEEEAHEGFEQFPEPEVDAGPPPLVMKLKPDLLEAKHWIYPLNKPKRDYQYNIVQHCLFENTLVALPTGLGKTFVAGVVMLNFYRWFPEGKVVFVAPTKPLVAQQIDACHQTCGIPGTDACELTGSITKPTRAKYWRDKRIFYMTPQTLINDLTTENCDPMDIVLLVIDEAHKGTGEYAYAQVVRFMMAKNPHFRILALTATPGSTPDAVQGLVDGLHISRIEIRDEQSLDLKEYIHKKNIVSHIIKMTGDITSIKDKITAVMLPIIKDLTGRGVLRGGNLDPTTMHPYRCQSAMNQLDKNQKWAYGTLSKLGDLCRGMGYLIESTPGMCYTHFKGLASAGEDGDGNRLKKAKGLLALSGFKILMGELEAQRLQPGGFCRHPKMEMLNTLIIQHFGGQLNDDGEGRSAEELASTKVMVFVTFRDAVDEIVKALNEQQPLIRATRFVGQGTDKNGGKGIAQKEQLAVIQKFKAGEYNVLVSTSIGEEGLDIGEIDLIVCYDAQKTPIRMLQRVGRTGRKRAGNVHVLMAEGREESNLEKAKATYKDVQNTIVRGEQLELYADVERLLPDHIKPQCVEKAMDIVPYNRGGASRKDSDSPAVKGTKRKRNDIVDRNIPAGASTGFVTVKDLIAKPPAKKKKIKALTEAEFAAAGLSDDPEEDAVFNLLEKRRTVSASSAVAGPSNSTVKPKKAASAGRTAKATKKTPTAKKMKPVVETASMEVDEEEKAPSKAKGKKKAAVKPPQTVDPNAMEIDDSDEEDAPAPSRSKPPSRAPPQRSLTPIDISSSSVEVGVASPVVARSRMPVFKASTHKPSPEVPKSASMEVEQMELDRVATPPPKRPDARVVSAYMSSPDLPPRPPPPTKPPPKPVAKAASKLPAKLPPSKPLAAKPPATTMSKPKAPIPISQPVKLPPVVNNDKGKGRAHAADAAAATAVKTPARPNKKAPPPSLKKPKYEDQSMAWLLDDDDDEEEEEEEEGGPIFIPAPNARAGSLPPSDDENDHAFMIDDPSLSITSIPPVKPSTRRELLAGPSRHPTRDVDDDSIQFVDNPPCKAPHASIPPTAAKSSANRTPGDMGPPKAPSRFAIPPYTPSSPENAIPDASFAVRPMGLSKSKKVLVLDSPVQSIEDAPPRRLQKRRNPSPEPDDSSPIVLPKRRGAKGPKPPRGPLRVNPYLNHEAEHSGEEVSEGGSPDEDEDPESESDRHFLRPDGEQTQASISYDQSMVYRESIRTQAPGNMRAPVFARSPIRKGPFAGGRARLANHRRDPRVTIMSSSPRLRQDDDSEDNYSMGSFVVGDDEEISYDV